MASVTLQQKENTLAGKAAQICISLFGKQRENKQKEKQKTAAKQESTVRQLYPLQKAHERQWVESLVLEAIGCLKTF